MTTPFTSADARAAGISRRRRAKLHSPFVGVHATAAPASVRELCRAYLPKMTEHEFFSHRTAAVLLGIVLPRGEAAVMRLDVSVVEGRAPRDARVTGHHLVDRPGLVRSLDGMRVAEPVEVLCQLATVLSEDDLVVAAESLLPPDPPGTGRSAVLLARIGAAFADDHRPARRKLARAAPRIRVGSRSPQESRFRIVLVAVGLPEPVLNHRPKDLYAEGDLVYPAERVWIEVEGDQHRTDKQQWRDDLVKYERLTDAGWRVIRISDDDIRRRPQESIDRVRRALAL